MPQKTSKNYERIPIFACNILLLNMAYLKASISLYMNKTHNLRHLKFSCIYVLSYE